MSKKGNYLKHSIKEINNVFINNGLVLLEDYINCKHPMKCINNEGYMVQINFDNLKNGKTPMAFHKNNPNTLNNIKLYIKKNNIKSKLLNGVYLNNSSQLQFECHCGTTYETSWASFKKGKQSCNHCGKNIGAQKRVIKYKEYEAMVNSKGYKMLTLESDYCGAYSSNIFIEDKAGYRYKCVYYKLLNNKNFAKCSVSNPHTIYNINLYLKKNTDGKYVCLSKFNEYKDNLSPLLFRHLKCGRTFTSKWININRNPSDKNKNRHGTRCPHCEAMQLESTHAIVLKQVWLHEKSNTIVEDKSCINPNTNMPLPTDIVNHHDKIAIEIQSWFHDFSDQAKKDLIKKEYWVEAGYAFYDPDIRDHTVLEMIQIFFPHIIQIPKYIDFEYANKLDDIKAQEFLNDGNSVSNVAKLMNVDMHRIYNAIYDKRIEYPKDYNREDFTAVIQCNLDNNFINSFKSIASASKNTGVKAANISATLRNNRHYSGGYYWYYANNYN